LERAAKKNGWINGFVEGILLHDAISELFKTGTNEKS
jgi:hypothetical protein